MIVYKNSSKGFLEEVQSNMISRKIHAAVLNSFGWNKVSDKEFSSWANSMQFMGNVIRGSGIADDCGILIEYNLPSTSLRVDFIISGHDETGKSSFIIIELKQWKDAQNTNKDGIVATKYHGECTHPSYQAYSYKLFLKDFNQNVYNSSIQACSCAYLHNYEQKNPEPLKSKIYESVLRESPIYFQDDQAELEEFIRIYVGKGKGEDILYQIERGNIRPSKKLIDVVSNLFEGNNSFTLLEEQKIAFENAKEIALNAKDKTVIVINGGPGTGKSVISMNLLGALIKKKKTIFVAPNASFREVMLHKLTSDLRANRVKHLFKGSSDKAREIWAKSLTKMRETMTNEISARIVMGGKTKNYLGKMPGILEEAILCVENDVTVYINGTFGGASFEFLQNESMKDRLLNVTERIKFYPGKERFLELEGFLKSL